MSELFSWDALFTGIFTVVGVIVGIVLSQLIEWRKDKRRKDTIRKALRNELEIIEKTLSWAETAGMIKTEEFPLITEIFDSIKTELASVLTPNQLVNLQRTYEEIKKLNKPSRTSPRGFLQEMGVKGYFYNKNDIKAVLELIKGLDLS